MPTNIPTELLRTFLAIVDGGSFSQAAEHVHRTQSAISMQIKKLEEILGKPLLNRDRKASTLTADGQILANYARRILQLNEEAVSLLKCPELTGWIKIGLPDDYASRFLPEILARFSRTHPRVQVQVTCEPSGRLLQTLKRGEIDLILTTTLDPNQPPDIFYIANPHSGSNPPITTPTNSARSPWPCFRQIAAGEALPLKGWSSWESIIILPIPAPV